MSVRADTLVAVPGRVSRRRREALTGIGLLLPSVALVLAFTIFPVGYNVWLGFYAKHSLRATSAWVGLGNYTQILTDPDFWRSVWLATVYAVMSTALQIVVGVAGALILHRRFADRLHRPELTQQRALPRRSDAFDRVEGRRQRLARPHLTVVGDREPVSLVANSLDKA